MSKHTLRAVIHVRDRVRIVGAALLVALSVQACSTSDRLSPEPAALTAKAVAIDLPNARFLPDEQTAELFAEGMSSAQREMLALNIDDPNKLPPANFLAISGGGDDGAFRAGLLVGWTESGQRPEFKIVTGVSTGSLIAPFAFLGPSYDQQLKDVYTTISAKDVFIERSFISAFIDDALSDTTPLFHLISKYLDKDMLADIAREYRKGRLLFVGTTYLDARRPVIWNIGAIAASGHPEAPELIRKILLASAAVPAAFPPVMIDVEVEDQRYQEMHVNGGAIAQLFLYPSEIGRMMTSSGVKRERHAYIIRNGRLGFDWSEVERTTLDIAGRAISTMIHTSGINDIFRVYMITKRDGVDFDLAFIESDFVSPPREGDFDPVYMNALYDYGYEKGQTPYRWKKSPPF